MIDRMSSVIGFIAHHRKRTILPVLVTLAIALFGRSGDVTRSAQGAGPFVVISDESSLGGGTFSGSVCYQVTRDADGAVISENCVASPATFAAPDGLEIGIPYSIAITLADPSCELLDDARVSDGSVPFYIRVNCDPSFLTATAAAQPTSTPTPLPTETPTPIPTPTNSPVPSPTPTTVPPTPTLAPTQTPIAPPETATPLPDPTAGGESEPSDGEASPPAAAISAPRITDWQVQELTGLDGTRHLRGALTYEVSEVNGAISVVVDHVPDGVVLLSVGEPASAGCHASELPLPVSLVDPVPVASCASGGDSLRQTLTFELLDVSPQEAISLTTVLAP
jgi:hypothetical protein